MKRGHDLQEQITEVEATYRQVLGPNATLLAEAGHEELEDCYVEDSSEDSDVEE